MNTMLMWRIGAGLMLVVAIGLGVLLTGMARRQERIAERLRLAQGHRPAAPGARVAGLANLRQAIARLGSVIIGSGILSRKTIANLENTLVAGGHRPGSAVSLVVGGKVALLLLLPAIFWFGAASVGQGSGRMVGAAMGAAIGLMLPDFIIGRLRRRYLTAVETALPDALDLLVICADAGLPLETAFDRVALEMRDSDPPTANELALTSGEMKIMPDRRQALVNLGRRTGLDSLTALGGTLAQTLQYGTPLTQALRTMSAELRHTMLMRFEERAARLPVLLTLPMMMFFLPCVILVAGGPAAVQVYHLLKG